MKERINIAEILKNKPKGTKLYTILSDSECFLNEASEDSIYIDIDNRERFWCLSAYGSTHSFPNGCVLLFPSKEMRDWRKFAWKKGDVLINSSGFQCIFKEWASDDYTKFNGCYSNSRCGYEDVSNAETAKFDKLDNNIAYGYVREIERKLGGILNLETLDIEKAQPEFKDGDIIYAESDAYHYPSIHILNTNCDTRRYYARLVINGSYDEAIDYDISAFDDAAPDRLRFATEEERQQLFKALANEGKAWDAEKKMIVVLKSLWTPKPFDKVLVRNSDADKWLAGFFEKFEKSWNNPYHIMNLHHMTDFAFKQCIPYEGNESLLGTTKDVEG